MADPLVFPLHKAITRAHDSELGDLMFAQIDKMAEEFDELSECIMDGENATFIQASGLMEETLDLIHAALGLCYIIERMHPGMSVERYVEYVKAKNEARGYYDA